MSEMTARERIATLLNEYGMWAAGDIYRERNFANDAEAVNDVIAIVREALLSEEAKRAVGSATESRFYNADGSLRGVAKGYPSTVITAALDAVFGPYKEDGGEGRPSERVEDVRGKYNRGEIQTAGEIVQAVMDAHDPDVISDLLEYNRTRGTKQ